MIRTHFSNYLMEHLRERVHRDDIPRLEMSLEVLRDTLSKTAHIPVASTVATGAALCAFRARLIEAIGAVRTPNPLKDRVSGEGSWLHKVLGLSSLLYFLDGNQLYSINKCVDLAIDSIRSLDQKDHQDLEALREKATRLLTQLVKNLQMITDLLGTRPERLTPIVEQLLLDYEVHLRGIPDLILEDQERKKAIVVEWKTGDGTPSKYEMAQVMAYAILEARRLGYQPEHIKSVVLGKLQDGSVVGFSIIPIIIRDIKRSGEIYPHPALAPREKIARRYREMEELIDKLLIEAEHLTVLLTNQKKLVGIDPEDLKVRIEHEGSVHYYNPLRYTPIVLPRGVPRRQDNYPCVSKSKEPVCNYLEACKFYFGSFDQKERYEKILWGLRFEALDEREKNLAVYRGLHESFKYMIEIKRMSPSDVLAKISEGHGIEVHLGSPVKCDLNENLHGKILVYRDNSILTEKNIDVIEEIYFDGGSLYAKRKIRGFEDSKHQEIAIPTIIREGAPVIISLMDSWSPLLSISYFLRVDDVDIDDDQVVYSLGLPSRIFEFQEIVIKKTIQGRKIGKFLMAEVDVDLTRADLETLDAFHRTLKRKSMEDTIPGERFDEELREELGRELYNLSNAIRSLSEVACDTISFEELLKRIISGGRTQ